MRQLVRGSGDRSADDRSRGKGARQFEVERRRCFGLPRGAVDLGVPPSLRSDHRCRFGSDCAARTGACDGGRRRSRGDATPCPDGASGASRVHGRFVGRRPCARTQRSAARTSGWTDPSATTSERRRVVGPAGRLLPPASKGGLGPPRMAARREARVGGATSRVGRAPAARRNGCGRVEGCGTSSIARTPPRRGVALTDWRAGGPADGGRPPISGRAPK